MNLSKIHHMAIIVSDYEAQRISMWTSWDFLSSGNYRSERKDWKLELHE